MKKMSEKTFIAICCLIGGIFPIAISILVKYNVIPLFFELPIFITMFTICVFVGIIIDKCYYKNDWTKKQTICIILLGIVLVLTTIFVWMFKLINVHKQLNKSELLKLIKNLLYDR